MDKTTLTEIIECLTKKLRAYYVFPNVAEEICDHLHQHLNEGDYSEIVDGELLADILTGHIQEINQDKHLCAS